jgi:hypothetical protein
VLTYHSSPMVNNNNLARNIETDYHLVSDAIIRHSISMQPISLPSLSGRRVSGRRFPRILGPQQSLVAAGSLA